MRDFLESEFQARVTIAHLDRKPGYFRHFVQMLKAGLTGRRGRFDLVVLSEFSLPFALASWAIARWHGAIHVVDFFVGLHETHVEDRSSVDPRSPRALAYRTMDRFALRSADLLLADTLCRADRWRTGDTPIVSLPVGAPEWAHYQPPRDTRLPLRLLYYGNYIPLHGLPRLVTALDALREDVDFELTLIGTGDDREEVETMVRAGRLTSATTFIDRVDAASLVDVIADHDVVMGIFGASPKAASVIANKVWQGLVCGRPVVTRAGCGVSEILPIVGEQLILEDGTHESLLAGLRKAINRSGPANRSDLALAAHVRRGYENLAVVLEELLPEDRSDSKKRAN
ncbi:glycosyltransferase [Microbacterium oleivorans]|uniref:glycosyltransferase n=1 Tax=Microbacterium oleivorans TaxID=273677 RepID=UPI000A4C8E6E|nr:glycosyltransferase [Microbacterium oleivorans]